MSDIHPDNELQWKFLLSACDLAERILLRGGVLGGVAEVRDVNDVTNSEQWFDALQWTLNAGAADADVDVARSGEERGGDIAPLVLAVEKSLISTATTSTNKGNKGNNPNHVHPKNVLSLLSFIGEPEEFEKDDLLLGHVAFITAATNVRCKIYSLPQVDTLSVQKVAGNIVPALATTTALVSGLVCFELVKLAGERVRMRKQWRMLQSCAASDETTSGTGTNTGTDDDANGADSRGSSDELDGNINRNINNIGNFGDFGDFGDFGSAEFASILRSSAADGGETDRLLSRFHNSFVNVGRGMLAWSEPVAPETQSVALNTKINTLNPTSTNNPTEYEQGNESASTSTKKQGREKREKKEFLFSQWDYLNPPPHVSTLKQLESYLCIFLSRPLGSLELQTASAGDWLLYANFIPNIAVIAYKHDIPMEVLLRYVNYRL